MTNVTEQLKDLADLLAKGLLTREQFEEQRDQVLAEAREANRPSEASPAAAPPPPGPGVPPPTGTATPLTHASPPPSEPPQPERKDSGGGIPLFSIGIGMAIVLGIGVLVVALGGAGLLIARMASSDSPRGSARSERSSDEDGGGEDAVAVVEVTTENRADEAPLPTPAPPPASIPVPEPVPADTIYEDPLLDATAEALFADHPAAWTDYERAVGYVNKRNSRSASPILDRLAVGYGGEPHGEAISLLLAANQVNQNLPDDALAALEVWKRDHPDSRLTPTALLWEGKAQVARARGKDKEEDAAGAEAAYRAAEGVFSSVLEQFPGDSHTCGEALYNLGSVYGKLEQPDQQREAYELLVTIYANHPLAPRALYSVGNAAWSEDDLETAKYYFDRLATTYPDDALTKRARRNIDALAVIGQPAPALVVDHWIGGETTLESQRGKLVLVVFWNEWCPHCKRELPKLQALWEAHRDQGFSAILVTKHTKRQTDEKVKSLLAEKGVTLPCAVEPSGYPSSKDYAITGVPAAALVDRDGTVVWRNHPARLTEERLAEFLAD